MAGLVFGVLGDTEEIALKSKGCTVSYVTSSYGGYNECSKIIDGQRHTYWSTTGLYPQVFILTFPYSVNIVSVKIRSYLVHEISVEKSIADVPRQFDLLTNTTLNITEHCHQIEFLHSSKFTARHLRFTIKSGYDHVCAIYRVEIQGIRNKTADEAQVKVSTEPNSLADVWVRDMPQTVGPFTSPRKQVGRNSPRARANELARMLSSFQSECIGSSSSNRTENCDADEQTKKTNEENAAASAFPLHLDTFLEEEEADDQSTKTTSSETIGSVFRVTSEENIDEMLDMLET